MRTTARLLLLLLVASPGGCAKDPGPDLLLLDAGTYHAAFDAALEASRRNGLPPALRDRRRGVIETHPGVAASLLEPWRGDNASLGQGFENTIAYQRRRARFEFAPPAPPTAPTPSAADAPSTSPPDTASDTTAGPDLLAVASRELDLSAHDGELELRVQVILERAHAMGVRRSTWSRRSTSRAIIDAPSSDGGIPPNFWVPVSRDEAFERRLLAAVNAALRQRDAQ